jgi:carbonic anhydrase
MTDPHTHARPGAPEAREALAALMEGNARFAAGAAHHPRRDPARRAQLLAGQHPRAIILGCADSRIAPEILFDQGLGDLFVVRAAGHVVDDVGLASVEYAVAHLGAPLVVVLAHSACGAVAATAGGHALPGRLPVLADAIRPAVDVARGGPGDPLETAAREHARRTAAALCNAAPILDERVAAGRLLVIAAYYDQATGAVELLEPGA